MSLNIELETKDGDEIYFSSIHNTFNFIALEFGIYDCLWGGKKNSPTPAKQIIEPLEKCVTLLATQKSRFEEFNEDRHYNGAEQFLLLCVELLRACRDNPDALVKAWKC